VARVAKALYDMGCYEISLGDTIGIGTPGREWSGVHIHTIGILYIQREKGGCSVVHIYNIMYTEREHSTQHKRRRRKEEKGSRSG
jgi:hypothetical protein